MKPENSAAVVSAATACVLSGTEQKNDKHLKLTLEAGPSGRTVVLHCEERIIFRSQARALSRIVTEVLPSARRMVVDLAGVESIDSSGLGELVLIHMWAEAAGYALKFAGARNSVRRLFEITNLVSVFDVYESLPEAMAATVQEEVPSA
jgi:anti-sigma B factor antagonist